jgi:hypothetical protein
MPARKRPRRWPTPGATPTAWSLPDAHSSADH